MKTLPVEGVGRKAILSAIEKGSITITPFRADLVGPATVDLTLLRGANRGELLIMGKSICFLTSHDACIQRHLQCSKEALSYIDTEKPELKNADPAQHDRLNR